MEFMTGYYRQKEDSTALLLQQYVCRGVPVCLGCICGGESCEAGIAGGEFTGQLLKEFRTSDLSKAARRPVGFLKRMEQKIERYWESCEAPSHFWTAGILCIEETFMLFSEGKVTIALCNTGFGQPELKVIGGDVRREGLQTQWGSMEAGIGILLASESFYRNILREDMKKCLAVRDIRDSVQTWKRVQELGRTAERRGGREMAALLLEVR